MNWIKKETKRANKYRAKLRAIIESKPYAFTQGVKKELEPKPYRTGRIKNIRGRRRIPITWVCWHYYNEYCDIKHLRKFYRQ